MSSPSTAQLQALLPQIETIAVDAGEAILAIYDAPDAVETWTKDDRSPLTAADLAAHRHIVAALGALEPAWPILSEEAAQIPWQTRSAWTTYWLVDPLDGTKEFLKRNGEFTVNIALIDQGAPVMGVVRVPVSAVTYAAIVGEGAWRAEDGDGSRTALRVRTPAQAPLTVSASRSHPSATLERYFERLGPHTLRRQGSSLKFCRVAEGACDLYPRMGPTSEWDTGAAQAVVEAAGGCVVRWDGTPLRYNQRESLLNPWFAAIGDPDLRERALAAAEGLSPEPTAP